MNSTGGDSVWVGDTPDRPWTPGEVFWIPDYYERRLSELFRAEVAAERRGIMVMLPMRGGGTNPDGTPHGVPFCIDSFPTSDKTSHWNVSVDLRSLVVGEKPEITVTPSINCHGLYHGYYTNGVIGPDLEAPAQG